MNRKDWEAQVKASDLNPTARLIALVLGGFGNWKVDKTVEPGESRVAKEAGLDPSTVATYMDAFVEQGWLRPVGKGRYNTTIYELCEVGTPATGVLAKTKRRSNPNSRKNLRKGGALVPDGFGKYKATQQDVVPGTTGDLEDLVPDTTGVSSRKEQGLVPERIGVSSRYHRDEPKEPSKENLEEPSATAEAAVANKYHFVIRDDATLPNSTNVANPVYVMDLEGVTGPLTVDSRQPVQPKRILTPGEQRWVDQQIRIYKLDNQDAAYVLELVKATSPSTDIDDAVDDALRSIGVELMEEAW